MEMFKEHTITYKSGRFESFISCILQRPNPRMMVNKWNNLVLQIVWEIYIWLVIWIVFHILGRIIPTDSYFSEGVGIPPSKYDGW